MPFPRPFALVQSKNQWRRAAHQGTALVGDVVQLSWTDVPRHDLPPGAPPPGAGLAFDEHCRLFHSVPKEGRVERLLWAATGKPSSLEVFAPATAAGLGDFETAGPVETSLDSPKGLAVDPHERLFIAEAGRRRILVFDLWSRRLLRVVPVPGRPVDLACHGSVIHAVLESPDGIVTLDARSHFRIAELPPGFLGPARVAMSSAGERFLLVRAGTAQARILSSGRPPIEVPRATNFEFLTAADLVIARHPGEDFLRFRVGLFLDACVPQETRLLVHTVTTDEASAEPTLPRTGPANSITVEIRRPDLSPPMPPFSLVPGEDDVAQPLHRRVNGRELPWTPF